MDPTTMDLDQIRDWAARRQGWERNTFGFWTKPTTCVYRDHDDEHPVPPTLDAIAGLMPVRWWWERVWDVFNFAFVWFAGKGTDDHRLVRLEATKDELLDRARLAMLATLAEDRNKEIA